MEAPGESGAGLLGAPSPTSFAPGHLEREKTRCTMCLMPAGHEQVGLSSPGAP